MIVCVRECVCVRESARSASVGFLHAVTAGVVFPGPHKKNGGGGGPKSIPLEFLLVIAVSLKDIAEWRHVAVEEGVGCTHRGLLLALHLLLLELLPRPLTLLPPRSSPLLPRLGYKRAVVKRVLCG